MKELFISIFAIFLIAQSVTAQEETGTNMRFEVNKNSQKYFKDGDHYIVLRDDNIKGFFEPMGLYNMKSGKIAGPAYEETTWYEAIYKWYIGLYIEYNFIYIVPITGACLASLIVLISCAVGIANEITKKPKYRTK